MLEVTSTRHLLQITPDMTILAGLEDLAVPRKCGRQKTRNNVPASTANEHFQRLIFIPLLDCFLREFNSRLTTLASQAVLNAIHAHVAHLTIQTFNSIYDRFDTDLDSTKTSLEQEVTMWKIHLTRGIEKPGTIAEILHHPSPCIKCFQTL